MRIYLLVFVLFFSIPAFAQKENKDKSVILKVLSEQNTAWNRGDINAFMKGYWKNDSLMFIGKSGVTYGWTNTLNNYKRGYPDTAAMGKLQFTIIEVKKISKKYYYITGKWILKRSIGDIGGHFTLLFQKINGEWVIIKDHSS